MGDKSGEWVKTGVVGAAVIGTFVYCQYKYHSLSEEIKELRENQRVMANYIKLLEARLAPMVNARRSVQNPRPAQPREPRPQEFSDSESSSDDFSDTEEEKPPTPKPRPHIHRPEQAKPRVRPERSMPRPAMPVSREDFETRERIRVPPSSALRREQDQPKPQPPKSQARVVIVTEEEEEEGLVANPVSMNRGVFDDDIDGDPADTQNVKAKRTTDRAAQMAAKAKARAAAIKERRGGK